MSDNKVRAPAHFSTRTLLSAVFMGLSVPAGWAHAQDAKLSTLFFSPAERTAIQSARSGNGGVSLHISSAVTVSGLVKRATDKGTVWLNERAVSEGSSTESGLTPQIGKRSVQINQNEVRVGETLDIDNGDRIDFVPPGSVQTRRAR
jgi:hypothetical protein